MVCASVITIPAVDQNTLIVILRLPSNDVIHCFIQKEKQPTRFKDR